MSFIQSDLQCTAFGKEDERATSTKAVLQRERFSQIPHRGRLCEHLSLLACFIDSEEVWSFTLPLLHANCPVYQMHTSSTT